MGSRALRPTLARWGKPGRQADGATARRLRPTRGVLPSAVCLTAAACGAGSAGAPRQPAAPAEGGPTLDRAALVERLARSDFPGRVGDLTVVPAPGEVLTYDDPAYRFMHGSPWGYDARIPLLLYGSRYFRGGRYADAASHQDIGVTLQALLGLPALAAASGRRLPALRADAPPPRLLVLLVLDGFRPDFLDRYAERLPTLQRLRAEGAWFEEAEVDYLPTATSVAHATLVTGVDPAVHGIPANTLFDRARGRAANAFEGASPRNLMAPALIDRWSEATEGRAVVAAQGGSDYPAVALAGHGGCAFNGRPSLVGFYLSDEGRWGTNPACYRLAQALAEATFEAHVGPAAGRWLGHDVTDPAEFRRSALFLRFEAEATVVTLRSEPFGADEVTDLLLVNLKATDYVAHKYGPFSPEMVETLSELDRQLAAILAALVAAAGPDGYALAITADHGMPPEPTGRAGRHTYPSVAREVNRRFDPEGQGIVAHFEGSANQMYLDRERLRALGIDVSQVAEFLEGLDWVAAAIPAAEVRRAGLNPRGASLADPESSAGGRPTSATAAERRAG